MGYGYQNEINPRIIGNYSDHSILLALHGRVFRRRPDGRGHWAGTLLKGYISFMAAVCAHATGVLFRYRHGSRTYGLVMVLMTASWIAVLNSTVPLDLLKPFCFWMAPAYTAHLGELAPIWEHLYAMVHSRALAAYLALYVPLALFHLLGVYLGRGNREATKRGESWLHTYVFSRYGPIGEFTVQAFVEPALTASIGYLSWSMGDVHFAVFLWCAAACTCLQEVLDRAHREAIVKRV